MSEYDVLINKYDALNAGYDQLYPKPMKHANTHANGGTDPITPSDIGAYSKNETDTLLQNNDPRKWGIGTSAVIPSGRSANNITADGLYYCDVDTPTGSDWLVYHAQRDDNWAVQLAVCSNAVEYGLVIRKKMSGVWKPWEWVNPPISLGDEYRTTERWLGYPVYVKTINFGAMTDEKSVEVVKNPRHVVRCSAVIGGGNGTLPDIAPQALSQSSCFTSGITQNADGERVAVAISKIGTALGTSVTATVTVWYTKTTD